MPDLVGRIISGPSINELRAVLGENGHMQCSLFIEVNDERLIITGELVREDTILAQEDDQPSHLEINITHTQDVPQTWTNCTAPSYIFRPNEEGCSSIYISDDSDDEAEEG